MNDFVSVLKEHAAEYPLMQPCDAVKLVYQSVFGGGHMIVSEAQAEEHLRIEYNTVTHTEEVHIESLGEITRIYLNGLDEEALTLLTRLFCTSAKTFYKGWETADTSVRTEFENRLADLRKHTAENGFAFRIEELDAYLTEYRAAGYPAVRHSEIYRRMYKPAYRVIDTRYVRLIQLLSAIGKFLKTSDRVVVAVDGRCASGKTTMAELIGGIYPVSIIHLDDFFLPGELRTPERMSETGGNLHRERFLEEVIPNLRGGNFTYRVFQCSTFTYVDTPREVEENKVIICEGSYALHPDFGKYYDIAVFSDIDPEEQLRRIRERDGEFLLKRFQREWIPMEERYFTEMHIREKCDYIV